VVLLYESALGSLSVGCLMTRRLSTGSRDRERHSLRPAQGAVIVDPPFCQRLVCIIVASCPVIMLRDFSAT
jgi:hypothetical protein